MLDNLYKNIGGKIKSWAKWIFIIEAISAIIAGFVLLFADDSLILFGLLTLVCGPFVAWVGSWVLYGFGELIEKTCDNENNSKQILEKLNEKTCENKITPVQTNTARKDVCMHKWLCSGCGNMRTQTPCECCGKE